MTSSIKPPTQLPKTLSYALRPEYRNNAISAIGFMGLIFAMQFIFVGLDKVKEYWQWTILEYGLASGVLIALIVVINHLLQKRYEKSPSKPTLFIDKYGIKNKNKWLKWIPTVNSLDWDEGMCVYHVNNFSQTMTGQAGQGKLGKKLFTDAQTDVQTKKNDQAFVVVRQGSTAPSFVLSCNAWDIDEVQLTAYLVQLGLPVKSLTVEEYTKRYCSKLYELGDRAGILAYGSIGIFVLALGVFYIDGYFTLNFGSLVPVLAAVFFIITALCVRWLYLDMSRLVVHVLVSVLFSAMVTLLIMATLLLTSPLWMTSTNQTFTAIEQQTNEGSYINGESDWVLQFNPNQNVRCRRAATVGEIKQAPVLTFADIARVDLSVLCKN